MIEKYHEQLEYDLWTRCEKTDLLDLWRGQLSYRKLQVLIDGLPPESLFKTAMRDDLTAEQHEELNKMPRDPQKHGSWSHSDMLLALVVDEVRKLAWLLAAVNSQKGKGPKYPEPLPRPGVFGKWGSPAAVARRIKQLRALRQHRGRPPGDPPIRVGEEEN